MSSTKEFTFCWWMGEVVKHDSNCGLIDEIVSVSPLHWRTSDALEARFYKEGSTNVTVFRDDMKVARFLLHYQPQFVHTHATILGLEFDGRGQKCSEIAAPKLVKNTNLRLPRNDRNHLYEHWFEDLKLACWGKVYFWHVLAREKGRVRHSALYVQYNWFTRMNFPKDAMDEILHNLPWANVTARHCHERHSTAKIKFPYVRLFNETALDVVVPEPPTAPQVGVEFDLKTSKRISVPSAKVLETKGLTVDSASSSSGSAHQARVSSYKSDVQFVCLNYAQSTNVAPCGITNSDKPILVATERKEARLREDISETEASLTDCLYLLDLQPHRRNVYISESDSKIPESLM